VKKLLLKPDPNVDSYGGRSTPIRVLVVQDHPMLASAIAEEILEAVRRAGQEEAVSLGQQP